MKRSGAIAAEAGTVRILEMTHGTFHCISAWTPR
jgi:hypothetical protein